MAHQDVIYIIKMDLLGLSSFIFYLASLAPARQMLELLSVEPRSREKPLKIKEEKAPKGQ
tara:strand:- start:279 stop:458 length:180 start_codon:yes stop_codon:yes gene_type:complete